MSKKQQLDIIRYQLFRLEEVFFDLQRSIKETDSNFSTQKMGKGIAKFKNDLENETNSKTSL